MLAKIVPRFDRFISQLPILMIQFRMIFGPVFFPLLRLHSNWPLVTLLIAGLMSDIFDGILARRLKAATLELRRFDTRVDIIFYGCAFAAGIIHSSFPLFRLRQWLIAYFVLFVTRNLVDYLRYRASPSYHMWSGKVWSLLLFFHLFALFCGLQARFFLPLAFTFYIVNTVEGIVATLLLPEPKNDIPSIWHAFVLSRGVFPMSLKTKLSSGFRP